MKKENRRFKCPPPCSSTNLTLISSDPFERKKKWQCKRCRKQFSTNSSDDSTDYFENQ